MQPIKEGENIMSTNLVVHKVKSVEINNRVFNVSGKPKFETIKSTFTDTNDHEITIDLYSDGERCNLDVIKAFTINGGNSLVIDS